MAISTGRLARIPFNELSQNDQRLIEGAAQAYKNAHNPLLRRWRVGAAVRVREVERLFCGANVETKNVRVGSCAEDIACFAANGEGYGDAIIAVAIVARRQRGSRFKTLSPCPISRIVLDDFADRSGIGGDLCIFMATPDFREQNVIMTTRAELPPCEDIEEGVDVR